GTPILDWSDWLPTFSSGSLSPQSINLTGTQTITYSPATTGATAFLFGTPAVFIDSPPAFPFNGTGGAADHYLDLYQDNDFPGEGSTHSFTFSEAIDNASITFWDIDANNTGTNNYVDEISVTATLQSGAVVNPTYGTIANPAVVTQKTPNTWSGIPFVTSNDNTNNGNVEVVFGYDDVVQIDVSFVNSTDGPTPGVRSGNHAIGVYDIEHDVTVVPNPFGASFGLIGITMLLAIVRRYG
ncbi:hypothetical protein ACFL2H_03675, partial [Planctomycetota bacterium]